MILDATAPDELDRDVVGLLGTWLPQRRWYPAKGVDAHLSCLGTVHLADDVRVLLVRARAGAVDVVLQVPVVLADASADDVDPTVVVGAVRGRTVLDAAGDPRFLAAWLTAADGPGADVDVRAARVVTGEQSNTSVVLPGAAGGPTGILKVLRSVADGENPDIDVPRRLVDAGWDGVPAPMAWAQARWATPDGGTAVGYLGVLSAFVPGAQDGFELACTWAREGRAFGGPAAELGATVAGMHDALVRAYGAEAAGDATAPARALADRFAWAVAAVPALTVREAAVRAVVDELAALASAPARQRVHGDLHLGQVLRSTGRWFVIDFEGEPLAPLAARVRPDLALRDVAGLLRSFDYAAAVGGLTGDAAAAWAADARAGLLTGYGAADDPTSTLLLRALELDKTLYEAVYEARNRPTWAAIPQAGLDRLLG
ncbi:aminoglycoside phosphotransferase [Cellulomonas flavigena DSM 20109]|uniref:Maltokinase n=1 Tax=Cellulomonas flavigena (strain ATCC 482 / DSM 20109 / BCRC 11376 / JCM 18109 / NBRC 3775 / NCIMB 8073 / NRS 134) TaxID=446466 RepID=D5ULF7_CELFN|nr:phosphotransferase [Cellulomonas flavigena]ADG73999.1 aminoglycoside phosphotransferase [Cellulomonas flavigena DSM 20109]